MFAIVVFVAGVALTLAVAGDTLGFDFLAYHAAATRVLEGKPAYDMSFEGAGGFGLFYYPPAFIPLVLPFGLLPAGLATWMWIAGCSSRSAWGRRSCRWDAARSGSCLLAGLSWPFLFAIKLGQVGPLLFLLFAIGWRWIDRGPVLGVAGALGAAIKIQPGLVLAWAFLTRRWAAVVSGGVVLAVLASLATLLAGPQAWLDFFTLIGRVTDPITTPNNVTPGALLYQAGLPRSTAALVPSTGPWPCGPRVRGRRAAVARGAVLPRDAHRRASSCRRSCGTTTRCCCSCRSPGSWIAGTGGRSRSCS